MSEQKLMSDEEKYKLLLMEREARKNGDIEEALRIRSIVPLDPEIADSVKKIYGLQYLIDAGYNLSEAEAVYGEEWALR